MPPKSLRLQAVPEFLLKMYTGSRNFLFILEGGGGGFLGLVCEKFCDVGNVAKGPLKIYEEYGTGEI